jgi:hypothetical protein
MTIKFAWAWLAASTLGCVAIGVRAADAPPPAGGEKPRTTSQQGRDLGANHPQARAEEERAKATAALEDELRMRLKEAEQELRKVRDIMRAVNDGRPVEGLRDTLASIQRDSTLLRIELAGAEARKAVIENSILMARAEAAKRAGTDPVSAQLRELVGLLEQSLKEQQELAKRAVTSNAEVRQAEVKVAEAKVKLLERQQAVMQQSGAADVAKLADQLASVSAQLVETQARLKAMEEMLSIFDKLQRLMEQEQEALWQVNKLRGMVEHVERVKLDRQLGVGTEEKRQ